MNKDYRIGVYTPHQDGHYFGKILDAICKVTEEHESHLVIIQTQADHPYDASIDQPLFLENMDACLVLLNAVGEHTLQKLARSDIPIIFIGYHQTLIPCHSVMIDNRSVAKQSFLHLLDHGHTDIAFIGAFKQFDQMERFEAYKEALRERNIPLNPELVSEVADSLEQGGADAAEALLLSGHPFTAVAATTDRLAIGAMKAFREHGLRVPGDIAIIGFDDTAMAAYEDIDLTTVKQPYQQVGRTAAEILFGMLDGKAPASDVTRIHVQFVQRSSCGCPPSESASHRDIAAYQNTIAELRSTLQMTQFNNYELIQGLIRATSDEKLDLSHLFWNSSHWGYLALWDTNALGISQLVVDRVFSKKGDPVPQVGQRIDIESFPSIDTLPASTLSGGPDIVFVHPIKTGNHDWGFLVLVGPLDKLNVLFANRLARHSHTILAAALERESLFERVHQIAGRLEIVSNTTNDGIWDWDLTTGKIDWNARIYTMLGSASIKLTDDPQSFINLVHPDDLPSVRTAFAQHAKNRTPFQCEFRLRQSDTQILWLYAAGEAIRDGDGKIIRIIGSFTDITKKKSDEARIIGLAYHDTLTGLPNRLYFLEKITQSLVKKQGNKVKLAVLMIDLDRFKLTNDTLGHHAGDELLQHTAEKLLSCIRPGDTIARLGGDEFIILLSPIQGVAEVEGIAGRITRSLAEPVVIDGQEIFNSASIGASLYPGHASSAESLIKFADMAMYKAKENGRNQMRIYTPELSSNAEKRFNLEKSLRRAVERNEFTLHYQPQIDLASGALLGVEALLRWNSPEHGSVPPSDFIALAEETGWIIPISNWVLQEACQQVKRWQSQGLPPLVMSVNISAMHFRLGHFPKWIKSVLAETKVAPQQICLEITETTAIQHMEYSAQILQELSDFGLKIAIDDFGTGHSSLMLLKRLPIHIVKIDKSFIRDMTTDQDDAAIVKAVIAMSHSLGLSVMAEGVEIKEQLEQLKKLGCDTIQGYYIGRPMPALQFEHFTESYTSERER